MLKIILFSIFNHSKVVDYLNSCCLSFGVPSVCFNGAKNKVWDRYSDGEKTTRVFNEAAPDDKHMAAKQTNNWATVALKAGVSQPSLS